MHHILCFNLFVLQNNSFDNQGSEVNKNDIFLRFDILSFTKIFSEKTAFRNVKKCRLYIDMKSNSKTTMAKFFSCLSLLLIDVQLECLLGLFAIASRDKIVFYKT